MSNIQQWLGKKFAELDEDKDFRDFAKISICCTLWAIWKGRNDAIFEVKNPYSLEVLHTVNYLIKDYYEHWLKLTPNREQQSISPLLIRNWRPPTFGVTKINSVASFNKEKNMAWVGIIARNENGEVVAGLTKIVPATSPLMAEALSFRGTLDFAVNMGITRIIVENDCLELIQACREEIVRGEIYNIVKDVITLRRNFQTLGFTWSPREGNQVAHHIALLANRYSLPSNWVWNLPSSLRSLFDADKWLAIFAAFAFDPGR